MSNRIAIGVLASAAPNVLEQTLSHWDSELCKVYIHVDLKCDIERYSFVSLSRSAQLLKRRHNVMWGGFSMIEAEIELMEAALMDGFEHFILISDDTVPLLSVDRLVTLLNTDSSWTPIGKTDNEGIISRYRNYYCLDINVSNPRSASIEYQPEDMNLLLELNLLTKIGKFPINGLYWNPNWKAMSIADVIFIVNNFKDRGHMLTSFRFSMNPDEHYMYTALGHRSCGVQCVSKIIWADFTKDPKPYVMTVASDFNEPLEQGYWFARKVHDPALAREVLSRIQPIQSS